MAQSYASWRFGRIVSSVWKFIRTIFPFVTMAIVLCLLGTAMKACVHEDHLHKIESEKQAAAAARQAQIAAANAAAAARRAADAAKMNPQPPAPSTHAATPAQPPAPPKPPPWPKLIFAAADVVPDGVNGDPDLIMIDSETGCQYIVIRDGRMSGENSIVIPRLHRGADGKAEPYCKAQ